MNTEQFRQSLKLKWLKYYRDNRDWLEQLGVWVSYEGQRRPSSSFILATVSVLEPRLCQMMPIVVGLSSNPDRVVKAMGLNFSPEQELEKAIASGLLSTQAEEVKLLPPGRMAMNSAMSPTLDVEHSTERTSTTADDYPIDAVDLYLDQKRSPHQVAAAQDAICYGVGGRESVGAPERGRFQGAARSQESLTQPTSTQPLLTREPLTREPQAGMREPQAEQGMAAPRTEEIGSDVIPKNDGETPEPSSETRDSEWSDNPQRDGQDELSQGDSEMSQSEAIAASFGKRFSTDSALEARDELPAPSDPPIASQAFQASEAYSF